jgi:hypothetical protein
LAPLFQALTQTPNSYEYRSRIKTTLIKKTDQTLDSQKQTGTAFATHENETTDIEKL